MDPVTVFIYPEQEWRTKDMKLEKMAADYEDAADKIKFEIQKALMPTGYYAFKVSSALGSGRIMIETRLIDFGDRQELQHLKDNSLLEFADKQTLQSLKESHLIP
jgi:hypothetical protein